MKIPFYLHSLDSGYASDIADVLDTPFLTSGAVGKKVEAQLNDFFDVEHCKLTNSWTNGAIAALLALDLKPGDEVIIPAMTFIASANVVEIIGAKSVFVDVDASTLLMDMKDVKRKITPRTKAIMPVHIYGQMLDVAYLRSLVGNEIYIIEDCAHCFEGSINGDKPGKHSDIAIFSFYATKNIACGEGGAIITNDDSIYERICQSVLHGMSAGAADRFKHGGYRHWDMKHLGTKANLPDLLAALLPKQIENIHLNLQKRENLALRYEDALQSTPIRLQQVQKGAITARHLFPIHVAPQKRDDVIAILNKEDISVTVNYGAVPFYTYYKNKYHHAHSDFTVAQEWGSGTISLPLYPKLSFEEQDYVIEILLNKVVPFLEQD